MTNEEMLSVAEIVERLVARFHKQADDHEAKMVEHRAAFGARTKADAETIDRLHTERDALRAEVAALQERLRASIARGDFAQMEVAALMSQTPKHPVKVGEWVRRLVPSPACGVGTVAKVVHVDDDTSEIEYDVKRIDGQHGVWFAKNCEPCDPPTVKVGDMVQLVKRPTKQDYELSWLDDWGKVGESFRAVSGVCTYNKTPSVLVEIRGKNYSWPLSCVEVVTEATHDTEAGKAAADAAVKIEQVAEDIKVGDLVEVVSNRGRNTWLADVGSLGTVTSVEEINESISVCLDDVPGKQNALAGYVSLCDVRKVTT